MNHLINKEALETLVNNLKYSTKVIKAKIVVQSIKTGVDYTYYIKGYTTRLNNRIIDISIESSYDTFVVSYSLINGKPSKRNKPCNTEITKGAVWILYNLYLENIDKILTYALLHHTGNCLICNRPLTDLESIQLGMGKTCRKRLT